MKAVLKTVTPLHIGNGVKYSSFEYLFEEGKLKRFSFDNLIEKAEKMGVLTSFLNYFKSLKNAVSLYSLSKMCSSNPYVKRVVEETEPQYILKAELKKGNEEIEEFIKSCEGVYIPGSEIKGSIRRALIIKALTEDEELYQQLKERLEEILKEKNERSLKKKLGNVESWLESKIFRGGRKNAQDDILKFLKVSDSEPLSPQDVLEVKEIGVFYVPKKRTFFSEVVMPQNSFIFEINVDLERLKIYLENFGCHSSLTEIFSLSSEKEIIEKLFSAWKKIETLCVKADPYITPKEKVKSNLKNFVRLGKHEGYLFTTVSAVLKEKDPSLFEEVFKFSVPKFSGFPNKTRKLMAKTEVPLGFCSVRILDADKS